MNEDELKQVIAKLIYDFGKLAEAHAKMNALLEPMLQAQGVQFEPPQTRH